MTLTQGDDYLLANGKELRWKVDSWAGPGLDGSTTELILVAKSVYDAGGLTAVLRVAGTIQQAGEAAIFVAELTAAQTAALTASPPETYYNYVYLLRVLTASGHRIAVARGAVHVNPG